MLHGVEIICSCSLQSLQSGEVFRRPKLLDGAEKDFPTLSAAAAVLLLFVGIGLFCGEGKVFLSFFFSGVFWLEVFHKPSQSQTRRGKRNFDATFFCSKEEEQKVRKSQRKQRVK